MIKYKAIFSWKPEIEKIEIEKETGDSYWIEGNRRKKTTTNYKIFDTFIEAKEFLIIKFENNAKIIRRQLEVANGYIGNAKGLKE